MSAVLSRGETWLACEQPKLKAGGLILLLCATGVMCPFSMDMYTPALPALPAEFATTASVANLTIVGFYLFFTLGMLIFGPVCDKTGRKPILVLGISIFIAGSFLCALASSIYALIAFRALEALGAGSVCAVTTAMVKDCFVEEKRTALLSILQILQVVGPVLAPLLGGWILMFSTWRLSFVCLALLGVLCLVLALMFKESLPANERTLGILGAFSNMRLVLKNTGFVIFLVVESFFSVAFMGYIASASYIYEDVFNLSAQGYTYFFAATAAISVLGPILYLQLEKRGITPRKFTNFLLCGSLAVAAVMLAVSSSSVWVFFACMALFALFEASVRPYATNLLLAQVEKDVGAASAVINFVTNIFGVAGMLLISLWQAQDYVWGLSILILASMLCALALWLVLLKSKNIHLKGLG